MYNKPTQHHRGPINTTSMYIKKEEEVHQPQKHSGKWESFELNTKKNFSAWKMIQKKNPERKFYTYTSSYSAHINLSF